MIKHIVWTLITISACVITFKVTVKADQEVMFRLLLQQYLLDYEMLVSHEKSLESGDPSSINRSTENMKSMVIGDMKMAIPLLEDGFNPDLSEPYIEEAKALINNHK
ncbi:hypothetical protein [Teredinibacter purpureus]|uniref:hypothetical protein n=1 Tax=Teredinibacter purpureus TaxID=2731756 RepID=UPI0005F7A666|nr:hypothetical protein [Teredinibacter purpureus]